MPTTTRGIYYPDSTTQLAPLENVFAQMASTTDAAITAASAAVYGRARLTADQTLTGNDTMQQIAFASLVIGSDVTVASSGLRPSKPGTYLVSASISISPTVNNTWRDAEFRVNGVVIPYARFSGLLGSSGPSLVIIATVPVTLAANDTVSIWTTGSQGGTVRASNSSFALTRIGV